MITPHRSGVTLLELLCSLALMGVLLGVAAPPVAHARNVLSVRAARDAIMNSAAAARALATGHGGATLAISAAEGTIVLATRDRAVTDTVARLRADFGVDVAFVNTRSPEAAINFDALGLGRLANRTISLQRGSVSGGVTFSAYGRARPW